MPILFAGDDLRSGRKAKALHGQHRCQWVNSNIEHKIMLNGEQWKGKGVQGFLLF